MSGQEDGPCGAASDHEGDPCGVASDHEGDPCGVGSDHEGGPCGAASGQEARPGVPWGEDSGLEWRDGSDQEESSLRGGSGQDGS